jgi:single stranded DNA-binding protein
VAKSVNKALLLGYVGKAPEIRSTASGTLVASLSLATAERQEDRQGNWTDRTEWHNLVAYGRAAEIVRDYVNKGTHLFVQGKIQTRSWDDKESGEKRYRTEIAAIQAFLRWRVILCKHPGPQRPGRGCHGELGRSSCLEFQIHSVEPGKSIRS